MTTDAVTVGPVSGSVTTSGRNEDIFGNRRTGLYRVTLSNSNPAAGQTFDPRAFGFQGIVAAVFIADRANAVSTGRYKFVYDHVNKKIITWDITDDDGADGDDLSTVALDVFVVGE